MLCERCRKESGFGAYYRFYYGKLTNTQHDTDYRTATDTLIFRTNWRYNLAGSKESWICHKCILKLGITRVILAIACVILSSFLIFITIAAITRDIPFFYIPAIMAIFSLSGIIVAIVPIINREFGSRRTIDLYRGQMTEKGYDIFLTPREFKTGKRESEW